MFSLFPVVFILLQDFVNAIPKSETSKLTLPISPNDASTSFRRDFGLAEDLLGQRTLLDIIWSCFVTIFACTWVIVHPNIPSESDSEWTIVGRRLKIMVYILLVPELILYWASKQWYAAREVARKHAARGWTKTHEFFIGMGGFVLYKDGKAMRPLDIADLHDLCELAELESWPDVSEQDIMDKSKGDYFTKSVVLIQTTWFVIQCIARGVLKLGLTELELVTLAFAALSGAMYFFWWGKPLDVRRPILVHATRTAAMQFSAPAEEKGILIGSESRLFNEQGAESASVNTAESFWRTPHINSTLRRTRSLSSLGVPFHDFSRRYTADVDTHSVYILSSPFRSRPDISSTTLSTHSPSTPSDSIRLSYLSRKYRLSTRANVPQSTFPQPPARKRSIFDALAYPIRTFLNDMQELRYSGEILSGQGECRVSTFYAAMHLKLEHELTILFLATATVYGAIHCTAWWFVFPSTAERWLWRLSALVVSILPSLFGLQWFLVVKFSVRPYSPSPSRLVDRLERIFHVTSTSRLLVMLAVYVIARIALLVLPLLSLRSLSPDAYIGISWTNVVPHL